MFLGNSLLSSSCPLTLGLSLAPTDRVWLCLLYTLLHQGFIHIGGALLSLPFSRSCPSLSWSIWQMFPVLWSSLWDVWSQVGQGDHKELWIQTEAFGGPSLPMRSLELVPGWCDWQPSSSVCPLALDAAEGTESLENLYVWSSKSPYRYILMCSLVSGT